MAKDPAVLFFIDKWLLATKEMKPDCKCWYHSLILHQFDKKSLPNDIEELANLADVRISEFERFKQVFEQVLKHKFKPNEEGRLVNDFANEIIKNRDQFKDKRSNAGKMSYFAKFMRKICTDENIIQFVLKNTDFEKLDTKNQQMLEQVFKQTSELYISVSVSADVSVSKSNYTTNSNYTAEEFFEEEDQPIITDHVLERKQSEIIDLICIANRFDQGEAFASNRRTVYSFVTTQLKSIGEIDHFTEQYRNYKEYKKQAKEIEHNFTGYFGTQAMQFSNGAWNIENYALKLEKLKTNNNKQTKTDKLNDVFGQVAQDLQNGYTTL